jgi:hypothetical protein
MAPNKMTICMYFMLVQYKIISIFKFTMGHSNYR